MNEQNNELLETEVIDEVEVVETENDDEAGISGGAVALGIGLVALAGYGAYEGVKKLAVLGKKAKAWVEAKKAEKSEGAIEQIDDSDVEVVEDDE